MRHAKAGRQFGRNTSHRWAMLRALTTNLVAHERIETTDAKAKELRRVAERVITRAIRLGPVAYTPHEKLSAADRARRQAAQQQVGQFLRRFAVVDDKTGGRKIDVVEKVFVDLAKRFKDRHGGYTRVIRIGPRRGDGAQMALIEFVDRAEVSEAAQSEAKAQGKAEKPKAEKASEGAAAEATEAKASEEAGSKAKKAKADKPKDEASEKAPKKSKAKDE
jgi:large subunit ribosomal protein L17